MDKYWDQWKAKADEHDSFPTGYFATKDGTQVGLWIVSEGAGMGGTDTDMASASPRWRASAAAPTPGATRAGSR